MMSEHTHIIRVNIFFFITLPLPFSKSVKLPDDDMSSSSLGVVEDVDSILVMPDEEFLVVIGE